MSDRYSSSAETTDQYLATEQVSKSIVVAGVIGALIVLGFGSRRVGHTPTKRKSDGLLTRILVQHGFRNHDRPGGVSDCSWFEPHRRSRSGELGRSELRRSQPDEPTLFPAYRSPIGLPRCAVSLHWVARP